MSYIITITITITIITITITITIATTITIIIIISSSSNIYLRFFSACHPIGSGSLGPKLMLCWQSMPTQQLRRHH